MSRPGRTDGQAARLAAIHAASMPRPWSAAEFASLLSQPGTVALERPGAGLVARIAADEAEILTLATDPACRRRGLARDLLHAFHAAAQERGARSAFLEVAEDNAAARALYAAAGYREVGRRARYYPRCAGAPIDALILTRPLGTAVPCGKSPD